MREDLHLPPDPLGRDIAGRFEREEEAMVTVLCVLEEEVIVAVKNAH